MDEYQLEIQSVQQALARLRSQEAAADLIDEYEAELRNLKALYRATVETFSAGEDDRRMRDALTLLGFGGWTLANVYAFVYDLSVDIEPDGRELAAVVDDTDFAGSLLEALDEDR
ncbi:MAG: hypothetical protein E6J45_05300 [Chloroflexi bacterium]|nr:MAG: hypothetical protein E6J45_05300 [Chloroflexota bacterium]